MSKLWKVHGASACIAKNDYSAYFAGQEYGFAIMLDNVKQLKSQLTASELQTEFGIFPPQSYRYLAEEWVALLNDGRLQATGRYKRSNSSSSLLKNLEMGSFLILAGRCWGGAVELDVIFYSGVGCTLTRGG